MTAMQKKEIRLEREKFEEKYKFCELDGRREQVGNFKVEPPDLFRGRGAHPKTGKLKRRIRPEDIVLNLGEGAPIPPLLPVINGVRYDMIILYSGWQCGGRTYLALSNTFA